jgi:hypothetical protein
MQKHSLRPLKREQAGIYPGAILVTGMTKAVGHRPALGSIHKGYVKHLIAKPFDRYREGVGELENGDPFVLLEPLNRYVIPLVDILTAHHSLDASVKKHLR